MNYKIEFSDKRRTLAIRIVFGEVTVHAPISYNNARGMRFISQFFADKEGWVIKKLAAYRRNINNLPGILEFKKFYWHGREIIPSTSPTIKKISFDGEKLLFPQQLPDIGSEFAKQLKRALKKQAAGELSARTEQLAARYGLTFGQCGITDAKTKWGVCTAAKKISLNWRLGVLDPQLCDYVIMHELCHLRHLDHSRAFWQSLAAMQPDCKERRQALKQYDFLMQYLQ